MTTLRWAEFWDQALHLTWASLKARYRKTFAGFLWVVLGPLAMFGVQSLVFRRFLRLEVPDYLLFLAGGLLPWIFLVQTVQMGVASLVNAGPLLRAFRVSPLVVVCASVMDNLCNLLVAFLLVLVPLALASDVPAWRLLLTPLGAIPFLIGALAITAGMAMLNVFFRDTNFVLNFLFSVLFFMTPVFYPPEYIPDAYRWLMDVNPLHHLLQPFRAAVHGPASAFPADWLRGMAWALALAALSALYWRKKRNVLLINL